jgi:hypothetical protein
MTRVVLFALVTLLGSSMAMAEPSSARASASAQQGHPSMKIRITVNDRVLTATLDDTAAARDFATQLPLAMTLEDYASTEKIAYLPRKLNTAGAPGGMTPAAGDIAYYAPWGNLAVFYPRRWHRGVPGPWRPPSHPFKGVNACGPPSCTPPKTFVSSTFPTPPSSSLPTRSCA